MARCFLVASTILSSLLLLQPASAFKQGDQVLVNYVGEPREARVIKEEGDSVKIEFRNALTGQFDGSDIRWKPKSDVYEKQPENYNPQGYGNVNGALQPAGAMPGTPNMGGGRPVGGAVPNFGVALPNMGGAVPNLRGRNPQGGAAGMPDLPNMAIPNAGAAVQNALPAVAPAIQQPLQRGGFIPIDEFMRRQAMDKAAAANPANPGAQPNPGAQQPQIDQGPDAADEFMRRKFGGPRRTDAQQNQALQQQLQQINRQQDPQQAQQQPLRPDQRGGFIPLDEFLRRKALDQAAADAANRNQQPKPAQQPQPVNNLANQQPAQPVAVQFAGPPLTENEIIDYFKATMGDDPNKIPWGGEREKIYDDMLNMLKDRGTAFKGLELHSELETAVRKYQVPSSIISALQGNYLAPVETDWFFGSWNMNKHEFGDGIEAGKADTLIIHPDGRYTWGDKTGEWVPATKADVFKVDKGESGVVLKDFRGTQDWVVYKDDKMPGTDNIRAADIDQPDTQFLGGRNR
jgi:hypothetical protein